MHDFQNLVHFQGHNQIQEISQSSKKVIFHKIQQETITT